MNWIERMYELKGRDLYSQNGEGIYLEYVFMKVKTKQETAIDIGGGDGFYLSNTNHLVKCGFSRSVLDKENGHFITVDNVTDYDLPQSLDLLSIDIDGNDYWVLNKVLPLWNPRVVCAEFNASYTDSRTIAYNPNHEWAGDSYYGFTFDAGVKLAEKHGYKVIFQIADMNMIMVRKDLIEGLYVPPVTFKKSEYFKMSERTDWIWI